MKKTFFSLVTICSMSLLTLAAASNSSSPIVLVGLNSSAVNNRGVSLDDISVALGTKDQAVNDYINQQMVSMLTKETKGGVEIEVAQNPESVGQAKQSYVVIEEYEVTRKGYPYDNFLHVLEYAVYDESNSKIFEGEQRFATLDCIDKKSLEKQLSKMAKRVIASVE